MQNRAVSCVLANYRITNKVKCYYEQPIYSGREFVRQLLARDANDEQTEAY